MTSPATPPSPVEAEVALGANLDLGPGAWRWTSCTRWVNVDDPLTAKVGRDDQKAQVGPSSCKISLINRDGRWTEDNPTGAWYGQIRRNTPIRILAVGAARPTRGSDAFGRVVVDGFGTADTGQTWQVTGTAGVANSDFQVTGSAATIAVTSAAAFRRARLSRNFADAEVSAQFTFPVPTGGALEPGLSLREATTSSYVLCRAIVATTGAVSAEITTVAPDTTIAAAVSTGLTHAAGTPLRQAARADGATISFWVWQGATRPVTPTLTVNTTLYAAAGRFGVRVGRASGNTTAGPQFTLDNFLVTDPPVIYAGFLTELPDVWDPNGTDRDAFVDATAAGVFRRLNKDDAVTPPLVRSWTARNRPLPVAYWPMDDEDGSTSFASIIPGAAAAGWTGDLNLASDTTLAGSGPMPTLNAVSYMQGISPVPVGLAPMAGLRWVYKVPSAPAGVVPIMNIETPAGNIVLWTVRLRPDLNPDCYDITGYNVNGVAGPAATAQFEFAYGRHCMFRFNQVQNGANVDFSLDCYTWDENLTALLGTTAAGSTAALGGSITRWYRFGHPDLAGHTLGHVAVVTDTSHGPSDEAPWGYPGESASQRIAAVCAEEGITTDVVGATDSQLLGPRPLARPLEIFHDAAETDLGVVLESGWGVGYLARVDRYNRPVALTLDYAAGHVAELLVDGSDQFIVNDQTVQRAGGTKARRTDDTHIAIYQRYPDQKTISLETDTQVEQQAGFRLMLGTDTSRRLSALTIDLFARPQLLNGWVALRIGDRIQVLNPPAPLPPDPLDFHLEGQTVTADGFTLRAQLAVSPAKPWQVFVVEGPGNSGRARSGGSSLTGAVTATATSFQVTTATDVNPWITTAGRPQDLPFDIGVGGERIQVNSITSASSPQTFNVTRSRNTVVKAHAAGAVVELWDPPALAL